MPVDASGPGQLTAGRRSSLVAAGVFVVLAVLLFLPAWRSPTHRTIGVGGDPALISWFLRWTWVSVGDLRAPFVSHALNAPFGVNMMWQTWMPLAGVVLLPIARLGTTFSYDLLVTLGVAGSAWTCFLAARRYVADPRAAFVAGLFYGFSPYMMTQSLAHVHVTLAFMPPLFLILLDEIVVRQRRSARRAGLMLGALAAAQMLVAEELLVTSAITAAVGLVVLAVARRNEIRRHLSHIARATAWAVGLFTLICAWPVAVQLWGPYRVGGLVQGPNTYVSDALGFFLPTRVMAFAPRFMSRRTGGFTGNGTEWNAYVGIPMIAVAIFTTVRHRKTAIVRFAAAIAIAMAILSLGPRLHVGGHDTGIHLPWRAFAAVPLLINVIPGRLILYTDLFLSILLAVFVADVLRSGRRVVRAAGAIAVALVLASIFPRLPYPSRPSIPTPPFFASGAAPLRDRVVLVVPMATGPFDVDGMVWHEESRVSFRMVGGYFLGPLPTRSLVWQTMRRLSEHGTVPAIDARFASSFVAELDAWHVGAVVLGPWKFEATSRAFLERVLGSPPQPIGGVEVWFRR